MDFEVPDRTRMMRGTVRRFVKSELEPISQQVEEEEKIPEGIVQKMRDLGLFGMSIRVRGIGAGHPGGMRAERRARASQHLLSCPHWNKQRHWISGNPD